MVDQGRHGFSYYLWVRAFLRSLWDEPRPSAGPVRVWRDWVLVAVLVPAAVLEGVLRPGLPLRGLSILVTVGLVATLLWRRIRPLLMVAVVFGVLGLMLVLTAGAIPQMYTGACVLILPYALFRWGSGREAVIGSAITAGKAGLSALPSVSRPSRCGGRIRCPALGDGPGGGVPVPGWGEDA